MTIAVLPGVERIIIGEVVLRNEDVSVAGWETEAIVSDDAVCDSIIPDVLAHEDIVSSDTVCNGTKSDKTISDEVVVLCNTVSLPAALDDSISCIRVPDVAL